MKQEFVDIAPFACLCNTTVIRQSMLMLGPRLMMRSELYDWMTNL